MSDAILEEFGKRLMNQVRDETISDWRMILSGQMKGQRAEEIRASLDGKDSQLVNDIVPQIVDSALHHLLRWLEEEEQFRICGDLDGNSCPDLANESDGFSGELPSEAGWIAKFSNES